MQVLGALCHWLEDQLKWEYTELGEEYKRNSPMWGQPKRWPQVAPTVPQQENNSDCGCFMLCYADCVARGAAFNFDQGDMEEVRQRICKAIVESKVQGY